MISDFYSDEELHNIGFASFGKNVLISRKARIYSPQKMVMGNHVRIDDFCILSGKIELGSYIHISAYTALFAGEEGIFVENFATISGRCNIYGKTDDYTGIAMTNPMVPSECTLVSSSAVVFEKHSIIGAGSTVLPGSVLSQGVAVGCMSLVKSILLPWKIYAGIPVRLIGERKKEILRIESQYKWEFDDQHKRGTI